MACDVMSCHGIVMPCGVNNAMYVMHVRMYLCVCNACTHVCVYLMYVCMYAMYACMRVCHVM